MIRDDEEGGGSQENTSQARRGLSERVEKEGREEGKVIRD